MCVILYSLCEYSTFFFVTRIPSRDNIIETIRNRMWCKLAAAAVMGAPYFRLYLRLAEEYSLVAYLRCLAGGHESLMLLVCGNTAELLWNSELHFLPGWN